MGKTGPGADQWAADFLSGIVGSFIVFGFFVSRVDLMFARREVEEGVLANKDGIRIEPFEDGVEGEAGEV